MGDTRRVPEDSKAEAQDRSEQAQPTSSETLTVAKPLSTEVGRPIDFGNPLGNVAYDFTKAGIIIGGTALIVSSAFFIPDMIMLHVQTGGRPIIQAPTLAAAAAVFARNQIKNLQSSASRTAVVSKRDEVTGAVETVTSKSGIESDSHGEEVDLHRDNNITTSLGKTFLAAGVLGTVEALVTNGPAVSKTLGNLRFLADMRGDKTYVSYSPISRSEKYLLKMAGFTSRAPRNTSGVLGIMSTPMFAKFFEDAGIVPSTYRLFGVDIHPSFIVGASVSAVVFGSISQVFQNINTHQLSHICPTTGKVPSILESIQYMRKAPGGLRGNLGRGSFLAIGLSGLANGVVPMAESFMRTKVEKGEKALILAKEKDAKLVVDSAPLPSFLIATHDDFWLRSPSYATSSTSSSVVTTSKVSSSPTSSSSSSSSSSGSTAQVGIFKPLRVEVREVTAQDIGQVFSP